MQQLLKPAERAQKAADKPSEQHAEQDQDTGDVIRKPEFRRADDRLKCADRGTRPPRRDRNSSSGRARRPPCRRPDIICPAKNSAGGYWSAEPLLPVSSRESGLKPEYFSYPIPTHSIHRRIAFDNTVSASPLHRPNPIIAMPTASRKSWAAVSVLQHCLCPFSKLLTPVYRTGDKICVKAIPHNLNKSDFASKFLRTDEAQFLR